MHTPYHDISSKMQHMQNCNVTAMSYIATITDLYVPARKVLFWAPECF